MFITACLQLDMQVKDLPSPHGKCEPSENYVQSKCLADCEANYIIEKCNCKDMHMPGENTINRLTRTVLTRSVSSYGLPAALSDYGVNAAGIAEIVVIFRNDRSLAEMSGSFA